VARPGVGGWAGRKEGNCLQKVENRAISGARRAGSVARARKRCRPGG